MLLAFMPAHAYNRRIQFATKFMKTTLYRSKSPIDGISLAKQRLALGMVICFGLASVASAQTVVQGNIGGTWSPSGNPYIAVANCTVTSTLILQPGVVFEIESNVTVTANGFLIQAVGTPTQRITIQGWPGSTNYYNSINVENNTGTNIFNYCDFANAQTAISMLASAGTSGNNQISQIMPVEIMNCTFSNCVSQAIYGAAQGLAGGGGPCPGWTSTDTLNPVIKNCVFNGTGNGCVLNISGQTAHFEVCGVTIYGYGYGYPTIVANLFQNLTGTAFLMQVGSYGAGGNPVFQNNTLVNCGGGVNATDPWNATIQDNIFQGLTNAMTVSGSLSRTIGYNDFFSNATNFSGLPAAYGQQLINNRNGTSSDVFYNIFQNPLFVATNNFQLQTNSTCIGAGANGGSYENLCSPPSSTSAYGDMGAYGGPDACNWLTVVPKLPVQESMTQSNSSIWLNWEAIPRSSYLVQYVATNLNATSGTNHWLTNTTITPAAAPVSISVSPDPGTNKAFYRVESMGRTPGN
jgi:hypothetical protein